MACVSDVRKTVAGEEGLEPSHAGIKIRCLYQLGDSPTQEARATCARTTELSQVAQPLGRLLRARSVRAPIGQWMCIHVAANPDVPTRWGAIQGAMLRRQRCKHRGAGAAHAGG